MDRKTITELVEYIAAAIVAVLIAVILAEAFPGPLWGGLTDAHFR